MAEKWKDKLPGGIADKKTPEDFESDDLEKGIKVEMEHTDDREVAREIAMDHLTEDPGYYAKLELIESGNHAASKLASLYRMARQQRARKLAFVFRLAKKVKHEEELTKFFKGKDGPITDPQFHEFAEELGVDEHKLEAEVYEMLRQRLKGEGS